MVLVPDGLDLPSALAVVHDGPTALRIVRLVDVRPGEHVLVLGAAGGMGILLVQLLRAQGARVIGAARGLAKVDAVRAAGADVAVDYGRPDWTSKVAHATGGAGPAVVLDGVGGQLGRDAYGIMADGGRFSAHGAPSGSFTSIDRDDAARRKITVTGLGDLQVRPGERAELARRILPDVLSGTGPPAHRPDVPAGRSGPRPRDDRSQSGDRQDAADRGSGRRLTYPARSARYSAPVSHRHVDNTWTYHHSGRPPSSREPPGRPACSPFRRGNSRIAHLTKK